MKVKITRKASNEVVAIVMLERCENPYEAIQNYCHNVGISYWNIDWNPCV